MSALCRSARSYAEKVTEVATTSEFTASEYLMMSLPGSGQQSCTGSVQ
jgi:hypothetical protein